MTHTPETRKRAYEKIKQRRVDWFKTNGPCRSCGSWDFLELDHIDPSTKISHKVWSWKQDRREEELAKCQVLCHNCHEEKTAKENSLRNSEFHHGTRAMYMKGCRCNPCTLEASKYRQANRRKNKLLALGV